MGFLRRLHEKTSQNISRSSCQNNEAPGEKRVESITEIMGGKSLFGFNQKRKGGSMRKDICSQCGETEEPHTMKQWSDFETDLLCDNCFDNKIKLIEKEEV